MLETLWHNSAILKSEFLTMFTETVLIADRTVWSAAILLLLLPPILAYIIKEQQKSVKLIVELI
jgi:hypothetical protein